MEVYIEYVLMDNLIINYLILLLTKKTINLSVKKINTLLSNVMATTFAVIMPLINLSGVLLFLYKILVGIIVVLIFQKPKNLKMFIVTFLIFISYTFMLGGFVYAITLMLNLKTTNNGIFIAGCEIPMSLLVLVFAIYVWVMFKTIQSVKKQNTINKFVYEVVLNVKGEKFFLKAFLDTGNSLYVNNAPIVVISANTFLKMFKDINYQKLMLEKITDNDISGAEYINVSSVNTSNKMLIFPIDNLEILNYKSKSFKPLNLTNVKIGLAMKNFNKNFDVILHRDLIGGLL